MKAARSVFQGLRHRRLKTIYIQFIKKVPILPVLGTNSRKVACRTACGGFIVGHINSIWFSSSEHFVK